MNTNRAHEKKRIITLTAIITSLIFILLATNNSLAVSKIPKVRLFVKPLNLTKPPTTEEIMAAGQLGGQLYPTDDIKDKTREKQINLSFGEAIQEWNKHEYKKAVKMFRKHVQDYPDSQWASEAVLHVGCDATYNGRYTEAEESFNWILEQNKRKEHEGAKILMIKAKARLGILKVYQNNIKEAKGLFRDLKKESPDWRDRTYASHWIQRLSMYTSNELAMLNCGTQALAYLLEKDGKKEEARKVIEVLPEIVQGHSIKNLSDIASQYGYQLSALKLIAPQIKDLPLPSIMHINAKNQGNSGHYWILEKVEGDLLGLFDPQAGRRFQQYMDEFAREWSGNALVFSNGKDLPGTKLADNEMTQIYGGCCGVRRAEGPLGGCPGGSGPCPCSSFGGSGGPGGSGAGSGSGPGGSGGPGGPNNFFSSSSGESSSAGYGAPVYSVNMINMNLFVTDTPLWYSSPIGPSVAITLSYNSQSAINNNEPFGNKWQFNYGSYLVVDTGGQVTIFMPDGRRDIYSPDGTGGYIRPYQLFT